MLRFDWPSEQNGINQSDCPFFSLSLSLSVQVIQQNLNLSKLESLRDRRSQGLKSLSVTKNEFEPDLKAFGQLHADAEAKYQETKVARNYNKSQKTKN